MCFNGRGFPGFPGFSSNSHNQCLNMFKWYPPNETAVNVFFDVESDLIVKKPMVFIIENPQLMFFKWYFPNETAELRGLLIQG